MKEITINYKKDPSESNYLVKRVIRQYGVVYDVISYFMVNNELKPFPTKVLYAEVPIKKYIEECKKSRYYKSIIINRQIKEN